MVWPYLLFNTEKLYIEICIDFETNFGWLSVNQIFGTELLNYRHSTRVKQYLFHYYNAFWTAWLTTLQFNLKHKINIKWIMPAGHNFCVRLQYLIMTCHNVSVQIFCESQQFVFHSHCLWTELISKEFRDKRTTNVRLNVLIAVVLLKGRTHEIYTSPYLLPVRGLNEIFIGESLSSR